MDSSIANQADSETYEKNLAIFNEKDAFAASKMEITSFDQIHFCQTEKGELNLYRTKYGIDDYYHAQTGALDQALEILAEESLKKVEIVCFYGLGLGYIYDALKKWLRESPNRQLVLMEDDLEVIYCFLHTSRATEILEDPQVTVFYFSDIDHDALKLNHLVQSFFPNPYRFYSLQYYTFRHYRTAVALCYRLLYSGILVDKIYGEQLSGHKGFLSNFYSNLLTFSSAHLASNLFEKFRGLPSIVCGAGPSIEKNIELLKTLKHRALIFSGGSSLNVVNAFGLIPHFGAGIDPNKEQFHRLLTNDTFQLPIFYRHRMSHEALRVMQGPKLYVAGSTGVAAWFEKELDLATSVVEEGHNVVNFCIEISRNLGCNPLIFVGMDLAFTEVKTYASGIQTHPLWLGISDPYAQQYGQEVIRTKSGLTTKWDWAVEADWISLYAVSHSELTMVNATEGGIGFNPVPTMTLKDVLDRYLTKTYDLDGWIHSEIHSHPMTIQRQQVIDKMNVFKNSLESCMKHCEIIVEEGKKLLDKEEQKTTHSSRAILHESLLHEEIAYGSYLKNIDETWQQQQKAKALYKKTTPRDKILRHCQCHEYLIGVILQHIQLMKDAVKDFIFSSTPPHHHSEEANPPTDLSTYRLEGNVLTIKDPDLDIDIEETAEVTHHVEKDEDGSVRWDYFRTGEELHGPSRFFDKNGQLLSETWFSHGKQEGKSRQYYASGRLYSLRRYRQDEPEGKQEFYFENGVLNTSVCYVKGRLDGAVSIYNSAGVLVRELYYRQDKRHGTERLWDHRRTLLMECEYKDGVPTGKAIRCDYRGKIEKEVYVYDYPKDFDISEYDAEGQLISSFKHGVEDFTSFFASRDKEIQYIEEALKNAMKEAGEFFKDTPYHDMFRKIEEDAKELEKVKGELEAAKKATLDNAEKARHQLDAKRKT